MSSYDRRRTPRGVILVIVAIIILILLALLLRACVDRYQEPTGAPGTTQTNGPVTTAPDTTPTTGTTQTTATSAPTTTVRESTTRSSRSTSSTLPSTGASAQAPWLVLVGLGLLAAGGLLLLRPRPR